MRFSGNGEILLIFSMLFLTEHGVTLRVGRLGNRDGKILGHFLVGAQNHSPDWLHSILGLVRVLISQSHMGEIIDIG